MQSDVATHWVGQGTGVAYYVAQYYPIRPLLLPSMQCSASIELPELDWLW